MSNTEIMNDYALAALFINRNNMEVTGEAIENIFKILNKPYLPKLGKMFAMDSSRFEDFLKFTASAGPATTTQIKEVDESANAKVEEEAEPEGDIEFDDLFG